jgi:hypothetical protein
MKIAERLLVPPFSHAFLQGVFYTKGQAALARKNSGKRLGKILEIVGLSPLPKS